MNQEDQQLIKLRQSFENDPEIRPDFTKGSDGLLPAIVQDVATLQVLMLGYMNETSFRQTLETGKVTFWSRSRRELWVKGGTSGNFFDLIDLKTDCDADAILLLVHPHGPACHRGTNTCFD